MDELSSEDSETLVNILQAANRHPNSRVAKLIRTVEENASQKNIVMLLMELADHAEYATDFGISLKYYLNLFEHLGIGRDIVLSEAGLLLFNSSKVYARRVDFVQELVERQILTLSAADREITEINEQRAKGAPEKPNRSRKRLVAVKDDPYEVELIPKKFRKLTEEKRFTAAEPQSKSKVTKYRMDTEQHIHPAAWVHANIIDLENEEEIDSKRNYKLFTYHVEHRYNTLVSDINFRLHFKVKDYIDEEEERLEQECNVNEKIGAWPPLSEAYIQKYLNLENKALALEAEIMRPVRCLQIDANNTVEEDSCIVEKSGASANDSIVQNSNLVDKTLLDCSGNSDILNESSRNESNTESMLAESGLGESLQNTLNLSSSSCNNQSMSTESGLGESLQNTLNSSNENARITSNHSALNESNGNKTNDELDNGEISNNSIDNTALEQVQKLNSTEVSNLEKVKEIENSQLASTINRDECELVKSTLEKSNDVELNESTNKQDQTNNEPNVANTSETSKSSEEGATQNVQKNTNAECKDVSGTEKQNPTNADVDQINLNRIRLHLPHHDDEGIYFSDLDEHDQLMLTPDVVATDVFPAIRGKENIRIIVDDEIKALLNIPDDEPETFEIPVERKSAPPKITLNILKIHEKFLRRRVLFKLGADMDLFLQARCMKRIRGADTSEPRQCRPMKLFPLDNQITPTECDSDFDFACLSDEECEFLGFTEEEQNCNSVHRLSRDSGVSVDVPLTPNTCGIDVINDGFKSATENILRGQSEAQAGEGNIQVECNGTKEVNEANESTEQQNTVSENTSNIIDQTENTVTAPETSLEVTTDCGAEGSMVYHDANTNEKETCPRNMSSTPMEAGMDIEDYSADIESDSMRVKIQRWHEHLQPILAKSRERHHFDVFQIGTEIMSELDNSDEETNLPKSTTFQDVMNNKDESYVSRYFLSALLLANQSNIKISISNKSSEAPSAWEDIHFELLSTKRHTVAIEDNIGMVNVKQNSSSCVKRKQSLEPTYNAGTANSAINPNQDKCVELGNNVVNVNLNVVRPLKQIEKVPCTSDDYDSGIFSNEDCVS